MRGAGASLFASLLSFLIHFLGTIVLTRLLTPIDFGLITMVTAFSLLLQNFGVNGFTEAVIQKEDLDHRTMSTLFWINAFGSGVLTIVFASMAPLLVWFYDEPQLYLITIAIAASIISAGMATMHMALLRRNMRFTLISWIDVSARSISVLAAIMLAWAGFGYWALVANTVVWPLFIAVSGWLFCSWRPMYPTRNTGAMPMCRFALHTYGNFVLNYFSRNIDKLLVGWRYGAQPLGFYKKAYDLFVLPAGQLIGPLNNVALATLSRVREEPERYRRYYLDAVSMIAFIGMPVSAALTLTGVDTTLFVLGPQWTKAGEVFCYFGASIGIMLIYGTQGWLHLSLGRPDRWVLWSVFECIVTALFFLAGLQFGIEGVAIGYTVSFYVLAWPCLSFAGRPINLSFQLIIAVTWRYAISALMAGLVSYSILYQFGAIAAIFSHLSLFLRILVASTLCFALYTVAIVLTYQSLKPIRQFFAIILQMLPEKRSATPQEVA